MCIHSWTSEFDTRCDLVDTSNQSGRIETSRITSRYTGFGDNTNTCGECVEIFAT